MVCMGEIWKWCVCVGGCNLEWFVWVKFGLVYMGAIWNGVCGCNLEMVCVGAIRKWCVWVQFGMVCIDQIWNGVYGCNLDGCVWVQFGVVCMGEIWIGVYG